MLLTVWLSNMLKNQLPLHTTIDARLPHTRGTRPAEVRAPDQGRLVEMGLLHVGREGAGLQLDNVFFAREKTVLALTTPMLFCLGKGPFTT